MKIRVIFTLIALIFSLGMPNFGHAFDLDETVDDDIRKNYNPSKLIDDVGIKANVSAAEEEPLPALPNITKHENPKQNSTAKTKTEPQRPVYTQGTIPVKSGTKFDVINTSAISDWQSRGTVIKFKTNAAITGKNYTIPASTIFTAEIIESHQPQITCNGGLVVIRVYSMNYKGQTVPVNASITIANDKKIFFNNIKGERKYWKTVWKKGNWGRSLFNSMLNLTLKLGAEGSTVILSPFPLAYGTICLGLNALTSPICAFCSKGGHVSIPAGKHFRIKLLEDMYL